MNTLFAFVTALADDVSRLAFADFLDENHPPGEVAVGELPPGFSRFFARSRVYDRTPPWMVTFGRFTPEAIWRTLSWYGDPVRDWLDGGGASLVAGIPVFVGEPRATLAEGIAAAPTLQALLGCPVSCSSAVSGPECIRLTAWYTLPLATPTPELAPAAEG